MTWRTMAASRTLPVTAWPFFKTSRPTQGGHLEVHNASDCRAARSPRGLQSHPSRPASGRRIATRDDRDRHRDPAGIADPVSVPDLIPGIPVRPRLGPPSPHAIRGAGPGVPVGVEHDPVSVSSSAGPACPASRPSVANGAVRPVPVHRQPSHESPVAIGAHPPVRRPLCPAGARASNDLRPPASTVPSSTSRR